ncbi:MAG: prolipoprotein diacylglyceryl transferase family protein [Candidatus Acidiferrales bacterium]|jgi:phosphatidylglycerol:prolipoprotein diacylglycerol transferase
MFRTASSVALLGSLSSKAHVLRSSRRFLYTVYGDKASPSFFERNFPSQWLLPRHVYSLLVIPFLHLGPLTLPTFGLMVATAMLCAYFVLRADILRRGIAPDRTAAAATAEAFIALPCLVGIVGAKLYHELQSPREFFAHPLEQILSQYGFAWFGGLLAGFAAYAWLTWMRRTPLLEMLDAGSPAAALGYGIGRIGCFLSGDGDYGIPTSLPWGMSFPKGLVPTTARVHPTPLYELIVAAMIAGWLWRLGARQIAARSPSTNKGGASANAAAEPSIPCGTVFAAYLALTGVARFLVEFIRINPRSFLGMSNAQSVGLLSAIVGMALGWYLRKRAVSEPAPVPPRARQ